MLDKLTTLTTIKQVWVMWVSPRNTSVVDQSFLHSYV